MKENVSGCFFLNTVYISCKHLFVCRVFLQRVLQFPTHLHAINGDQYAQALDDYFYLFIYFRYKLHAHIRP